MNIIKALIAFTQLNMIFSVMLVSTYPSQNRIECEINCYDSQIDGKDGSLYLTNICVEDYGDTFKVFPETKQISLDKAIHIISKTPEAYFASVIELPHEED